MNRKDDVPFYKSAQPVILNKNKHKQLLQRRNLCTKSYKSPALEKILCFFLTNVRYVGRGCHTVTQQNMLEHFMHHSSVSTSKEGSFNDGLKNRENGWLHGWEWKAVTHEWIRPYRVRGWQMELEAQNPGWKDLLRRWVQMKIMGVCK